MPDAPDAARHLDALLSEAKRAELFLHDVASVYRPKRSSTPENLLQCANLVADLAAALREVRQERDTAVGNATFLGQQLTKQSEFHDETRAALRRAEQERDDARERVRRDHTESQTIMGEACCRACPGVGYPCAVLTTLGLAGDAATGEAT